MKDQFEVRVQEPVAFVGVLRDVQMPEIGKALGEILPATFAWLGSKNVRSVSAPMSAYYGCKPDTQRFVMLGGAMVSAGDLGTLFGEALEACRIDCPESCEDGMFRTPFEEPNHPSTPRGPAGAFVFGELGRGEVVSYLHKGPYDQLGAVNRKVDAWIKEQRRKTAWPSWETYLNDCSEVTDPSEWLTEVVWPLR